MPKDIKLKMSLSDDRLSTFSLREKSMEPGIGTGPRTSYEVFRNNTTAVEVIVKEVPRSKKSVATTGTPDYCDTALVNRFKEDIDRLKNDLKKAQSHLEKSRKGFRICVREMQKQVDSANLREIDTRAMNLALQLENEKLKTYLLSKTNLVCKLKKEMSSLKRVIKFVVKNILWVPQTDNLNVMCSSDPEYDDFEGNLKKDFKIKFARLEETSTFDSTMSKETKITFDKRP